MFDHALVSSMRCELDIHGNRISVSYHAPNGQRELCHQLMAEKRTTYDTRGFITAEAYFDKDGMPTIKRDGFSRCEYTRNAAGSITEVRYFDTDGKPCIGSNLIHHAILTLDEYGNCNTASYFNTEDKPCFNADHAHHIVSNYDEDGRLQSRHYFNEEKQPTYCHNGYHSVEYAYDEYSNLAKESYFGLDKHPCRSKNGMASILRKYDSNHNITHESYYDTDDTPCTHVSTLVASFKRKYDENNNKIKESYYNVTGCLTNNLEEVSIKRWKYNHIGYATEVNFYNNKNKLTANHKDIIKEEYSYNSQGCLTQKTCYSSYNPYEPHIDDLIIISNEQFEYNELGLLSFQRFNDNEHINGNYQINYEYDNKQRVITKKRSEISQSPLSPSSHATDLYTISEYKFKYDERGNKIEEAYYDASNLPILHPDGYFRVVTLYNAFNHIIGYSYYDTFNQPCCCKKGYSTIEQDCDSYGRPIRIRYYNENKQPIRINGFAISLYQYDNTGKILKCSYFTEQEQPILATDLGIASFACEYDSNGRKIRERYYGLQGEPIHCLILDVASIEWTYNLNNQVKTVSFRDKNEKKCKCIHGYACRITVTQQEGIITKELFCNEDGQIIFKIIPPPFFSKKSIRNDIHLFQGSDISLAHNSFTPHWEGYEYSIFHYDHKKNQITESNFDSEGMLQENDYGYAKAINSYDDKNNLINNAYYDFEGKLRWKARHNYTYGQNNKLLKIDSFKYESSPYQEWTDYAKKVYTYNENGEQEEEVNLNYAGELFLFNGFAHKQNIYDYEGHILETIYSDTNREILNRTIYTYDENGNLTEETNVDSEDNLCEEMRTYARKIYTYDENGDLAEETYLDAENSLCEYNIEGAKKVYSYDKNGNLADEIYLDSQDNLFSGSKGYAKKAYTYDQNNNLTKETFYSEYNEAITSSEIGYCHHYLIYDEKNRLIKELYLDHLNQPCYIDDSDGILSGNKWSCFSSISYNYSDITKSATSHVQFQLDTQQAPPEPDTPLNNQYNTHCSNQPHYFAFISYSSKDVAFANKLQKSIESFKLPAVLSLRYPRSPRQLKPIFRDRTDLEQGNLGNMLMKGLSSSKYLLVICSENSAKPNRFGKRYVDMEVNSFIALNPSVNKGRVIPIIYRKNKKTEIKECLPPAISEHGLEGIDLLQEGIRKTFNRISARMAEVNPDSLWKHRQKKNRQLTFLIITLSILLLCGISLGGIYASIIALISAGILLYCGVKVTKERWGTRVIKYAQFIEENNLPIGIRELSSKEVSHRSQHYKFYYKSGRLRKVECCNSLGKLKVPNEQASLHSGVARIELFYNHNGEIDRQLWSNENGIIMRDIQFEIGECHDYVYFRYPNNLNIAPHQISQVKHTSPVTCYDVKRNIHGVITEIHYLNHSGSACADNDGTWGKRFEIDEEKSLITGYYCLNNEQNPMLNNEGFAGRLYEYDGEGNMTSYTNVNIEGIPAYEKAGFSRMNCMYDSWGNRTHVSYLNSNGELILNHNLFALKKTHYNSHGLITEESFFNTEKKLSQNREAYAISQYEYDNNGRIITISYYDETGKPCKNSNFYHRVERVLTTQGLIIQESYFDESKKSCYHHDGIHQIVREYDTTGNITSERYFNLNKIACYNSKGYHMIRYKHDNCYNITGESYYDIHQAPCYNFENVTKTIRQFDASGNCINEAYYTADEKPCINKTTQFSTIIKSYNSANIVENEQYYTQTGAPALNNEYISEKKWYFDIQNKNEVVRYLPSSNNIGHLMVGTSYDEIGQKIEIVKLGAAENMIFRKTAQYNEIYQTIRETEEKPQAKDSVTLFDQYHETIYEYNERNNVIVKKFTDISGAPIANNEGITEQRFEYDRYNRKTAESYYDTIGNKTLSSKGYARVETDYDNCGHICQYSYYDTKGIPCRNAEGFSTIKLHNLPTGRISMITYLDEINQPVSIHGYSRIALQYNHAGHMLKCCFMNEKGNLTENEVLKIATYNREYDINGRLIKEFYTDSSERLCRHDKLNVSIIEWEYDEDGRIKTVSFKDENGDYCNCIHGYAHRTILYDEHGYISQETFDNKSGKRFIETRDFEYSAQPTEQKEATIFDEIFSCLATEHHDIQQTKYKHCMISYNDKGNILEEAYFDSERKPCTKIFENYSRKVYSYNQHGLLAEEAYFDENDNLCIVEVEIDTYYARKTYDYDEKCRIIKEAYYNTEGELICIEGINSDAMDIEQPFAYITYSYETNEAGEEIKKARYYDKHGNEVT